MFCNRSGFFLPLSDREGVNSVPVVFARLPKPRPMLWLQFVQNLRQSIFQLGPSGIYCGLIQSVTFVGKPVKRIQASRLFFAMPNEYLG